MLEELTIAGLGVIADAALELGPGFNVVTGETGAGKTMVVAALGLLLGERADSGAVREGAGRARVQGRWTVEPDAPAVRRVVEAGAELDEDSMVVARTVSAEGRSRAIAGGAGVPAALLASLAADLVTVHGQSEQQSLLSPARQRRLLDGFGGAATLDLQDRFSATFDRRAAVAKELDDVVTHARERVREKDLLVFGLNEIEALEPRSGEDVELRDEELRLAHVDGLRRSAELARLALSGDELASAPGADALSLVASARKNLEAERDHDLRLAELADSLATASYALADVAADLSSYADSLEVDPLRLGVVQERRAALGGLLAKYGDSVDDVLAWAQRAAARVDELSDDDDRIERLRADLSALDGTLVELGNELTERRTEAGHRLARSVSDELTGLAMPHAEFHVSVVALDQPTREGFDDVTFLLRAHSGAEPRALSRGASGGELSRVMLALEVCLADSQPVPTMVFDEVDAGVGGKAAVEVGRRLSRLAKSVQVIVVTHLPQVAAFADHHYVVVKAHDGSVTTSGVTALDEGGRRRELSRMLAGLEDSDTALAHVDELVQLAQSERAT